MTFRPTVWRFDAKEQVMRLLPRFANVALAQFVDGETYVLEVRLQRSSKQHAWFFSSVGEAWKNLSDEARKRYPTPEHLRKWAMVKSGFYHEESYVFGDADNPDRASIASAERAAILARKLDDYAVIVQRGNVVRIYTAASQSYHAADAAQFKQQADAVLEILSGEIGVSKKDLEREGKLRGDS